MIGKRSPFLTRIDFLWQVSQPRIRTSRSIYTTAPCELQPYIQYFSKGYLPSRVQCPMYYRHHFHVSRVAIYTTASSGWEDEKRKHILTAALNFVGQYGWTDQAIAQGVLSCGYPPSMMGLVTGSTTTHSCHPLIEFFMQEANEKLRLQLLLSTATNKNGMVFSSKKERWIYAIRTRLLMNEPFLKSKRWSEGMALGVINPSNAIVTSRQLQEMLDIIYQFSILDGEEESLDGVVNPQVKNMNNKVDETLSIDRNPSCTMNKESYPTNQIVDMSSIALVYIVTELFMLTDQSEGYKDTWEFLSNRLSDVLAMQGTMPTPLSMLSTIQAENILRPEVVTATTAVVSSLGGAVLSLLTPMAKMGVGTLADVIIPQILSSMQPVHKPNNST